MTAINVEKLKKSHWSESDTEKAELVLHFVQTLMNEHNVNKIADDYRNQSYIQHNRNLAEGIDGVIKYFSTLTKRFPEFSYDVKHAIVDGDIVTLHSHATVKKSHIGDQSKGFNIVDIWRVEDGKLIEHWDAVQPLDGFMRLYYWLTGGAVRNNNGLF